MTVLAKSISLVLALVVLAGCSYENPNQPLDTTARGNTPQMRLVTATGLEGVETLASDRFDAEAGLARDAVITGAGVAGALPGLGSLGGAGFGVVSFLNSPSNPAAADLLIATTSIGADPEKTARQIEERIYRAAGPALEKQGYQRQQLAKDPTRTVYVQPGCPIARNGWPKHTCSAFVDVELDKAGVADGKQVYRAFAGATGPLTAYTYDKNRHSFGVMPSKKLVDMNRGVLYLYLSPQKRGGAWTPASVYYGQGVSKPL